MDYSLNDIRATDWLQKKIKLDSYTISYTEVNSMQVEDLKFKNLGWGKKKSRMNLEPILQSEISQKEKNKCHILMHMYVL